MSSRRSAGAAGASVGIGVPTAMSAIQPRSPIPKNASAGAGARCGVIPQERRRSRRECRDRRPCRDGRHPATHPDPDTRSRRSLLRDDARGSIRAGESVGIDVPAAMAAIQPRNPIPKNASAGAGARCGVIPQERRRSRRECRDRRPYRNVGHPATQPDPDTRSLRSLLRDDARGGVRAGASVGIDVPAAMAAIQPRNPIPKNASAGAGARCGVIPQERRRSRRECRDQRPCRDGRHPATQPDPEECQRRGRSSLRCHPAGAPAQPARVSGSAALPQCRPSSHAARSRHSLAALAPAG